MMEVLTGDLVLLGAQATDKEDAIRQAGELLVNHGCVAPAYVDGMLARERVMSTYLGNGIAIPHGQSQDLPSVYRTGVSVLQVPEGVAWEDEERAYLVIGLASNSNEHIPILINLTEVVQNQKIAAALARTCDPMEIVQRLTVG